MKSPLSCCFTLISAALLSLSSPDSFADPISFMGKLTFIEFDGGNGVYSGSALGTPFSGVIDDVTANGNISNGSTQTSFSCCIAAGALEFQNNETLDSATAGIFNSIAGSNILSGGQAVDFVDLEGDAMLPNGNRIEIGLNFVFAASTFDSAGPTASLDTYEPLLVLFFILEETSGGDDVYAGNGPLMATPSPQSTGTDSGGATDASLAVGITNDAGVSYTDDVQVGDTVSINAVIEPDSAHIGEDLNVVVAVEVVSSGEILLLTPAGLFPFTDKFLFHSTINGAAASNILALLDGFVATEAEIGNYLVYLGYLVENSDGFIYYTTEPAALNVQ